MALFRLGQFTFKMRSIAPHRLNRSDSWRWAETERLNGEAALQYLGRGAGEISLEATLYPFFIKGHSTGSIDQLRSLANAGLPMPLILGNGRSVGFYTISGIDTDEGYFTKNGSPRQVHVTLNLMRYGSSGGGSGIGSALSVLKVFG